MFVLRKIHDDYVQGHRWGTIAVPHSERVTSVLTCVLYGLLPSLEMKPANHFVPCCAHTHSVRTFPG